jgi:hypothetical protein
MIFYRVCDPQQCDAENKLQRSVCCEVNGSCPANEDNNQQWLLGQGVSLRTGTADGVLLHLGEAGGTIFWE